jgi:hypothetical protein
VIDQQVSGKHFLLRIALIMFCPLARGSYIKRMGFLKKERDGLSALQIQPAGIMQTRRAVETPPWLLEMETEKPADCLDYLC